MICRDTPWRVPTKILSNILQNNVVVELARLFTIKQTKPSSRAQAEGVCHYNYYKTQAPPNLLSGTFSLQSGHSAGSKFSTTFR